MCAAKSFFLTRHQLGGPVAILSQNSAITMCTLSLNLIHGNNLKDAVVYLLRRVHGKQKGSQSLKYLLKWVKFTIRIFGPGCGDWTKVCPQVHHHPWRIEQVTLLQESQDLINNGWGNKQPIQIGPCRSVKNGSTSRSGLERYISVGQAPLGPSNQVSPGRQWQ